MGLAPKCAAQTVILSFLLLRGGQFKDQESPFLKIQPVLGLKSDCEKIISVASLGTHRVSSYLFVLLVFVLR